MRHEVFGRRKAADGHLWRPGCAWQRGPLAQATAPATAPVRTHGSKARKPPKSRLDLRAQDARVFDTGSNPVAPGVSQQVADPTSTTIPAGGQQTVCLGVERYSAVATRCAGD